MYDAINVMIAIGIITKDNNNTLQFNTSINEKEKTLNQIKFYNEKMNEKRNSIMQRQEALVKLVSKVRSSILH